MKKQITSIRNIKNDAKKQLSRKIRKFTYYNWENFIFIHINKTGGSSIEKAFNLPLMHKTALERIAELGVKKWESKFTFAVVRNPWDRVVSQYHHRLKTNQTNLQKTTVEFNDWVRLTYDRQDSFYYNQPTMFMPQYKWIADNEGKILVNFVCRFENFNKDFNYVCEKIGKTIELPHVKASKRGNYKDYYEKDTIKIVEKWYEKDIDSFNYSFK